MKKRVLGSIMAGAVLLSGCAADLVILAMHAAEEGFTIGNLTAHIFFTQCCNKQTPY